MEKAKKGTEKGKGKGGTQSTLDGVVQKVRRPTEFTPAAILLTVTQHVVVNDQVSIRASSAGSAHTAHNGMWCLCFSIIGRWEWAAQAPSGL